MVVDQRRSGLGKRGFLADAFDGPRTGVARLAQRLERDGVSVLRQLWVLLPRVLVFLGILLSPVLFGVLLPAVLLVLLSQLQLFGPRLQLLLLLNADLHLLDARL